MSDSSRCQPCWIFALCVVIAFTGCGGQKKLSKAQSQLAKAQAALDESREELKRANAAFDEREMDMELPPVAQASPLSAAPELLVVEIGQDGRYAVEGEELSGEQLQELLDEAAREDARQGALIRAEEATQFRHVVHVMEMCRRAGIADYRMELRQAE